LTEPGSLLVAGRVGRPHGLDGSFHVTRPVPVLLAVGTPVLLGDERTEIVGRKGTEDQPILRVAAADDRDAIAARRGRDILVDRAAAPGLEADEFWAADLEGCTVLAGDEVLGRVERMVGYPSCEVLVVGEHLIPLVRDAIRAIDVSARRIEVDRGFLGL
jgi:16S rRNA processing protein RimM